MKHIYLAILFTLTLGIASGAYAQCSVPSGAAGDQIYNSSENKMQYCNGSIWVDMGGGVPPDAPAADNMGSHRAEQNLDMNNNRIVNMGTSWDATDDTVIRKTYVDNRTGANETDPKIGAVTNNSWCVSNGTTIECDTTGYGTSAHILYATDTKPASTTGGTTSNNSWQTRVLTELEYTNITGASLASNQITLPAGTYRVRATLPFVVAGKVSTRLYDVTNGTPLLYGSTIWTGNSSSSGEVSNDSVIEGTFELTGSTVLELQSYKTQHNPGGSQYTFQGAFSSSTENIYSTAFFIRVADDPGCRLAGVYVPNGGSHDFYDTENDIDCSTHIQTRNCTAGTLDGNASYQYANCEEFMWVNSTNTSHAAACAGAGMGVATDQGYGICASGEARPTEGPGWDSISYVYGTFAGTSTGGNHVGSYCYRGGQTQDNDGTDRIVAHLCHGELACPGGADVAGTCWYLGATGQSCDTVCSSHGGYNAVTNTYAGGGGNNTNCQTVLNALGIGWGSPTTISLNTGCFYRASNTTRYRGTQPTSSSQGNPDFRRACACNDYP